MIVWLVYMLGEYGLDTDTITINSSYEKALEALKRLQELLLIDLDILTKDQAFSPELLKQLREDTRKGSFHSYPFILELNLDDVALVEKLLAHPFYTEPPKPAASDTSIQLSVQPPMDFLPMQSLPPEGWNP